MENTTKWEFIKQTNVKAYYVYKDDKAICKIRFGNTLIGKFYKVVNSLSDKDGVTFSHLSEAKAYIKANY